MNGPGSRNDLANLLGDGDGAGTKLRVARPVTGQIVVAREGETVLLKFGNADPIRLPYRTAIETGQHLLMDAVRGPFATLRLVRGRVTFPSADALRIGNWLIAKGNEAKFLASDTKRIVIELE